jgi:hypothetical protein
MVLEVSFVGAIADVSPRYDVQCNPTYITIDMAYIKHELPT